MLDRVLKKVPELSNPNVIVGRSSFDDAGVYRLSDDLALVHTVDFFTPIVDDPFDYGRIAAVNSLSDVYAMGGRPISALNILAFPVDELPEDVLIKILEGASEICAQAGVASIGGHSVEDKELKFGLAVTGTIHPEKILTNSGAKPGDILILSKALGTGLISTALMNDAAKEEDIKYAIKSMTRLNRLASEAALKGDAHAATDVTGFGLLGHLHEMAVSAELEVELYSDKIPYLPGSLEIAESGKFFTGGEHRNRKFVGNDFIFDDGIPEPIQRLTTDPQTSGGLLIALDENNSQALIEELVEADEEAWIIGRFITGRPGKIHLKSG